MIHIQEALRAGQKPEFFTEHYGIKVKAHSQYPNLLHFKYDQIESPMGDPLVQQCRGLILDSTDNWKVIAYPFDKFFNSGEGHAAKIDWTTASVQEKLDGSLTYMYWYKGDWHVATSGTPDASGGVDGASQTTFKDLFWDTFARMKYNRPNSIWQGYTFIFELMTPFNRVVVRHIIPELRLIGVRSPNQEEINPEVWDHNFVCVREFPLRSLSDLLRTFDTMDPLLQEGYVVTDERFHRIKVKHPGYVALHLLRGEGFGPRRVLEVVRAGEHAEVLNAFPEWTSIFEEVVAKYLLLIETIEDTYRITRDIETQKGFALAVCNLPYSGVLFGLRGGKVSSAREALKVMHIDRLMDLLEAAECRVN